MLFIYNKTNNGCRDKVAKASAWTAIELAGVANDLDDTKSKVDASAVDAVLVEVVACEPS